MADAGRCSLRVAEIVATSVNQLINKGVRAQDSRHAAVLLLFPMISWTSDNQRTAFPGPCQATRLLLPFT